MSFSFSERNIGGDAKENKLFIWLIVAWLFFLLPPGINLVWTFVFILFSNINLEKVRTYLLTILQDFFVADGEGLPRSTVEREAKFSHQVLSLFSLQVRWFDKNWKHGLVEWL